MNNIPTQTENPEGLHQRYYIQKIVKNPVYGIEITDTFMGLDNTPEFLLQPVDDNAEYFVLRLDENGSDPNHIKACRDAILQYAISIRKHIPQLAEDLINRYSE